MFFKYTVLFKANLIFKDFSRQSYIFKYFSIKPVRTLKHAILSSADIVFNLLFQKLHSAISSECQTVWIHFKSGILSILIWVLAVYKGYDDTSRHRVSEHRNNISIHCTVQSFRRLVMPNTSGKSSVSMLT